MTLCNTIECMVLTGIGSLLFSTLGVFLIARFTTLGVLMARKRFAQLEKKDELVD